MVLSSENDIRLNVCSPAFRSLSRIHLRAVACLKIHILLCGKLASSLLCCHSRFFVALMTFADWCPFCYKAIGCGPESWRPFVVGSLPGLGDKLFPSLLETMTVPVADDRTPVYTGNVNDSVHLGIIGVGEG